MAIGMSPNAVHAAIALHRHRHHRHYHHFLSQNVSSSILFTVCISFTICLAILSTTMPHTMAHARADGATQQQQQQCQSSSQDDSSECTASQIQISDDDNDQRSPNMEGISNKDSDGEYLADRQERVKDMMQELMIEAGSHSVDGSCSNGHNLDSKPVRAMVCVFVIA